MASMNTVQHVDNDGKPIKEAGVSAAIKYYCNYQERCHQEVRTKLYELGCRTEEVEEYITELIESGILNEERFARLFAGGKFRMLQWGREKIRQQLKFRKISDYCIRKAMTEIDDEAYVRILNKLADKKLIELKRERSQAVKKGKLYRYLVQKGYERDLVADVIKFILDK
jgi:regulatory protein